MKKITFVVMFVVSLMVIGAVVAFAEDVVAIAPAAPAITPAVSPDMQWIWGEVVTVDSQNNKFTIKYLDYETDQEKELVVAVDEKTVFENVKSAAEIKPQDTLSLDYIVDGVNNIAKNVSVEKPEVKTASEAAAIIPEDAQPLVEPAVDAAP
ncbi:MAG: hypothetical protein V1650_01125 [Candidatus Omnitrophota bacterium]